MASPQTHLSLEDPRWSPDVLAVVGALEHEVETLRRREMEQSDALARLTEQVEQAGRLQRRLLASPMPGIRGADLHTLHRPAGAVGGDFYEVTRIDDHRVALVVADATGHDVAAGLLSTLIKGSVANRCRGGSSSESFDPSEVLASLNRELLHCALQDCEFVTAVCAVYDEAAQTLTWARGGGPYPVLIRPSETLRVCPSNGMALGIHDEATFESVILRLEPGDVVVLHTDGLDALLGGHAVPSNSIDTARTMGFGEIIRLGIEAQFSQWRARLDQLGGRGWHVDDVTAIALRVRE